MKRILILLIIFIILPLLSCSDKPKNNDTTLNASLCPTITNGLLNRDGIKLSSNAFQYYQDFSLEESSFSQTKVKLYQKIKGQTVRSYSNLWNDLAITDSDPDNSNNVILFYCGVSVSKSQIGSGANANQPTYWNREHIWARSHGFQGDEGKNSPAYTDLHHIRPTEYTINLARNNKDFNLAKDTGTSITSGFGSLSGCYQNENSFEPRDEVKGDVARMLLYMMVRYNGYDTNEPNLSLVDHYTTSTSGIGDGQLGLVSILYQWHLADKVNQFEMTRNDKIQEIQHNRNPFIDHPEWADFIFTNIINESKN